MAPDSFHGNERGNRWTSSFAADLTVVVVVDLIVVAVELIVAERTFVAVAAGHGAVVTIAAFAMVLVTGAVGSKVLLVTN